MIIVILGYICIDTAVAIDGYIDIRSIYGDRMIIVILGYICIDRTIDIWHIDDGGTDVVLRSAFFYYAFWSIILNDDMAIILLG